MSFVKRSIIFSLLFILIIAGIQVSGQANIIDFSRKLNLFVSQENFDTEVPNAKAIQVLESYFSNTPLRGSFGEIREDMSQREFLIRFGRKRLTQDQISQNVSDDELYYRVWLESRRMNWLPVAKLTYGTMREFLYRYEVSAKHGYVPYHDGLVLDISDINIENYNSMIQIQEITQKLSEDIQELRKKKTLTKPKQVHLAKLESYYDAFIELKENVKVLENPLYKIPNLPEDIREKIISNNLNEVLDSISYNYSSNNESRKYNLVTGVMQMNGLVYQPGEEIDFTKELTRDGWDHVYKYGWVIIGGEEKWAFGGGVCGSSTITFTPSWRAGLEVVSRYPHSNYYYDLYPEGSFGLDATIYLGSKNLIMKNNTNSPVLFYVVNDTEKEEVTLYLIGNSLYRNIEIEGPIDMGQNTVKWIRRMEQFDGTVIVEELESRYNRIK